MSYFLIRAPKYALTFQLIVDGSRVLQYNNRMKRQTKLQKNLNVKLLTSIILSVMLPSGIAMIIVGATNRESGGALFTAIMAIGIVFVVLGFYGAPIAWMRYFPQKNTRESSIASPKKVFATQRKLQITSRCNPTKWSTPCACA